MLETRKADEAPRETAQGGFALITVLLVLVLLTGLTTVAHMTTRSDLRIGANYAASTEAYYAAEAGAEHVLSKVKQAMGSGMLTQDAVDDVMEGPPDVPQFTFTEYSATVRPGVTNEKITEGPYAGMWSRTRYLDIVSAVEGPAGSRSRVEMTSRALAIPIFQFGIFYDGDLENCPGPEMHLRGRVHSNEDVWLGNGEQYFHEMITTAGQLHLHGMVTGDCGADDDYYLEFDDASLYEFTKDVHDFCSGTDPDYTCSDAQDKALDDYSKANWEHRIQTASSGIKPMDLPLPTGMDPREVILPCDGSETAAVAAVKYACNADITIRIQGNAVKADGLTDAEKNAFVDWQKNQFYDAREQTTTGGNDKKTSNRDVINLDMSALTASMVGGGVIYVHAKPGEITYGKHKQTVVRVRNGSVLPAPITVATRHPLYVQGNYNSDDSQWQPASLASDAITILSNDWQDSDTENQNARWSDDNGDGKYIAADDTKIYDAPDADGDTKVQAAIMAGHTATTGYGVDKEGYGGWFNNFPRFLEDWDDKAIILGSFVSMWTPSIADSRYWCCDPIYVPPVRDWGFDDRLSDPANLPPHTPVVGQLLRVGLERVY